MIIEKRFLWLIAGLVVGAIAILGGITFGVVYYVSSSKESAESSQSSYSSMKSSEISSYYSSTSSSSSSSASWQTYTTMIGYKKVGEFEQRSEVLLNSFTVRPDNETDQYFNINAENIKSQTCDQV